jgi:hypothetical protein
MLRVAEFATSAALFVMVAGLPTQHAFAMMPSARASDPAPAPQLTDCRALPHWHQWRLGRGCGEIEYPRERTRPLWRPHDWRRLR